MYAGLYRCSNTIAYADADDSDDADDADDADNADSDAIEADATTHVGVHLVPGTCQLHSSFVRNSLQHSITTFATNCNKYDNTTQGLQINKQTMQ